jgi:hypothetical protein
MSAASAQIASRESRDGKWGMEKTANGKWRKTASREWRVASGKERRMANEKNGE